MTQDQDWAFACEQMAALATFHSGLLARTSHELRSPISSVLSLHQLILNDLCETPEEEREFIAQICQYLQVLMQRLDEVVQIAKWDYGSFPLESLVFPWAEVLGEVVRSCQLQATNRNLRLEAMAAPVVSLQGDRRLVVRALVLLIDSLIRLQEQGTIGIATHVDAQGIAAVITTSVDPQQWQQPPAPPETPPQDRHTLRVWAQQLEFSPTLKITLVRRLLAIVGGELTWTQKEGVTQLHCVFPRSTAADPPA